MSIVIALLVLAAAYCGAMWLVALIQVLRGAISQDPEAIERHTFHLGLCFILSIGFLGLILKGG